MRCLLRPRDRRKRSIGLRRIRRGEFPAPVVIPNGRDKNIFCKDRHRDHESQQKREQFHAMYAIERGLRHKQMQPRQGRKIVAQGRKPCVLSGMKTAPEGA
jgi:hypothetical protein